MEETITIPKAEYDEMQERIFWLECLEAAGVDNWQGIGEANVPTSLSDYLSLHSINSMNLVHFLEQCVIHSQYTKFEMVCT